MTDTIFVVLNDTIAQTDPTILSEVEAYYNNALTRILGIIGIVVAIMAIAFPIYIFFWQRLAFRHEIIRQTQKFKEEIQKDYDLKIRNLEYETEIGIAFSIAIHARNVGRWVKALSNFFIKRAFIPFTVSPTILLILFFSISSSTGPSKKSLK